MSDASKWEHFQANPADDWEYDVWLMARRMALMYHYLTEAIIARLGDDEGRKIIKAAIWKYGVHCGEQVGRVVERKGLPLTEESLRRVPDLPKRVWRTQEVPLSSGEKRREIRFCPLAVTWRQLGTDPAVARLYCIVDQAKIAGYNNEALECAHAHNVLDGDEFCEVVFKTRSGKE
ncbi:MAG: L-2-amino-thiazoline-4-carboxylic acid hydrolase [Ignavibacteriales bacterium]